MEAVDGLDQVLRRLTAAYCPDLRPGDENLCHLFRRRVRLPGGIHSCFHCRIKRVGAGREFDCHVRDDVSLPAEVPRELFGIHFAAAEHCQKAAWRFQHVFIDGITAAGG